MGDERWLAFIQIVNLLCDMYVLTKKLMKSNTSLNNNNDPHTEQSRKKIIISNLNFKQKLQQYVFVLCVAKDPTWESVVSTFVSADMRYVVHFKEYGSQLLQVKLEGDDTPRNLANSYMLDGYLICRVNG